MSPALAFTTTMARSSRHPGCRDSSSLTAIPRTIRGTKRREAPGRAASSSASTGLMSSQEQGQEVQRHVTVCVEGDLDVVQSASPVSLGAEAVRPGGSAENRKIADPGKELEIQQQVVSFAPDRPDGAERGEEEAKGAAAEVDRDQVLDGTDPTVDPQGDLVSASSGPRVLHCPRRLAPRNADEMVEASRQYPGYIRPLTGRLLECVCVRWRWERRWSRS